MGWNVYTLVRVRGETLIHRVRASEFRTPARSGLKHVHG